MFEGVPLKCSHICFFPFFYSWLYLAVGDAVTEDEVVCEIETDKVHLSKN